MSFETICVGIVAISVICTVATFLILKKKKWLNEKTFIYGIFGAGFLMVCSNFLMSTGDFATSVIDALFMGMVFYNVISMFGVRMGRIHQDNNSLLSFFSGFCIIGNLFTLFMLGVSGYLINMYQNDPVMIEYFGAETIELLFEAFQLTIIDYGYLLVISVIIAILIGYMAIDMVSYAMKNNTIKTILKAMLILSAYYVVNLFVPTSTKEGLVTVVAYIAVLLSAYLIYQESKHDKPSIEIVIK